MRARDALSLGVLLRQAGTRDPLLQCFLLGKLLKNTKKLCGTKYSCVQAAVAANSGPYDTKRPPPPQTQLPLLKNWEQKSGSRSKSRELHMPPMHSAP